MYKQNSKALARIVFPFSLHIRPSVAIDSGAFKMRIVIVLFHLKYLHVVTELLLRMIEICFLL